MTDFMSAAEIRHLLVIALRTWQTKAVDDLLANPEDAGDPETGRPPYELLVDVLPVMLRQMRALPDDDLHFVRLAELVPDMDTFTELLPDTAWVPLSTDDGPEVTPLLDHLVELAEKQAGAG